MDVSKVNILDLSPEALRSWMVEVLGLEPYRATQLAKWVYRKGETEFAAMTDLPVDARRELELRACVRNLVPAGRSISADGTVKYLFELSDGERIESVLIPDGDRTTLCVSTQVGCLMGCTFCLTGTLGKKRDLTPGEIVSQYMTVGRLEEARITNIVYMGMGEPLDNLEGTIASLEILTHKDFLGLSPRRITVSTCGLVPAIYALAERVPVNLSISLNAPDDELRASIMPVDRKYPITELLEAASRYPSPRGKGVTFEYVLIDGINDSDECARKVASLLVGIRCMVNLIPLNEVPSLGYKAPPRHRVEEFQRILIASGIRTMIRKSRGRDILGACGMLAARYAAAHRRTTSAALPRHAAAAAEAAPSPILP